MGLQVSTRQSGDITILDLCGNLLGSEGDRLRVLLRSLLDIQASKVLLNFTDLRQIDSYGISVVVQAHLSLKKRGGELKLLAPGGQALKALTVLHLLELIPKFEDENKALASFTQVVDHTALSSSAKQ